MYTCQCLPHSTHTRSLVSPVDVLCQASVDSSHGHQPSSASRGNPSEPPTCTPLTPPMLIAPRRVDPLIILTSRPRDARKQWCLRPEMLIGGRRGRRGRSKGLSVSSHAEGAVLARHCAISPHPPWPVCAFRVGVSESAPGAALLHFVFRPFPAVWDALPAVIRCSMCVRRTNSSWRLGRAAVFRS